MAVSIQTFIEDIKLVFRKRALECLLQLKASFPIMGDQEANSTIKNKVHNFKMKQSVSSVKIKNKNSLKKETVRVEKFSARKAK